MGTFGKKSIINQLHRSPHTGVDLAGKKGDPVVAINHGRVLLAADHFFSGKSVYVNHGGGIISMYFHLDKILVNKGDDIHKGEVIGLIEVMKSFNEVKAESDGKITFMAENEEPVMAGQPLAEIV